MSQTEVGRERPHYSGHSLPVASLLSMSMSGCASTCSEHVICVKIRFILKEKLMR